MKSFYGWDGLFLLLWPLDVPGPAPGWEPKSPLEKSNKVEFPGGKPSELKTNPWKEIFIPFYHSEQLFPGAHVPKPVK